MIKKFKIFERQNLDPYGEEDWEIPKLKKPKPITYGRHVIKFIRPVEIELELGYYNSKKSGIAIWYILEEDLNDEYNITIMNPGNYYDPDNTLFRIGYERMVGWLPNDSFIVLK